MKKQRQPLSANFAEIGKMTLQKPITGEQQQRYDPFANQPKNQGKLGQNYFGEVSASVPEQIDALSKLKKKLKHQDLIERGYTINEKPRNHELGHEVALEAPLYDLFDLPNPHYRKQFFPTDLHPTIGYNYNDPEFENNEDQFLDDEDKLLIQGQLEKQEDIMNKKKFLLSRVNKTINKLQDQEKEQRKKEMDQAVMRVILGKNSENDTKNKKPRGLSLNNRAKKSQKEENLNQRENQKSNSPRRVRFDLEVKQDQNEIKNKSKQDQPSKKQPRQNKEIKTDWREKSSQFREALKSIKK